MKSLPQESYPALFDILDARSQAYFRRSARLGNFDKEAQISELRSYVLELLASTTFPFTHAAYVLGLNGEYFSSDTVKPGERHYAIPSQLPSMICRLFRLVAPSSHFTTIRMQKLTSAANSTGQHRTLPFCFAAPLETAEISSSAQDESPASHMRHSMKIMAAVADVQSCSEPTSANSHALFLTAGCSGGRGDLCVNVSNKRWDWQSFAEPSRRAQWISFVRQAWLRLHFPWRGDFYMVTVACEPEEHRWKLSREERHRLASIGFHLPADDCESEATKACSSDGGEVDDFGGYAQPPETPTSPVRRSAPAVHAAKQLLGLEDVNVVSIADVEDAFRRAVRAAHPDRAPAGFQTTNDSEQCLAARTQGWAVSRLTWARRVLRDVAQAGGYVSEELDDAPSHQDLLMLAPPAVGALPENDEPDADEVSAASAATPLRVRRVE